MIYSDLQRQSWQALDIAIDPALLKETVVLKLNGGLGTGMGLDKAQNPVPACACWLDVYVQR